MFGHRITRPALAAVAALAATALGATAASAAPLMPADDVAVNGLQATSAPGQPALPLGPFSQNKQNEPAVAVDANDPTHLAAGANDNVDMELCNAGDDTTCPFTEGVGVSGLYLSSTSGGTWHQPQYDGWTARGVPSCDPGVVGPDPGCQPAAGKIGTLPNYFQHGLVSDGDPALAFGPRPDGNGGFSYDNGSRLYYANLTSAFPGRAPFAGFEAIAVSHSDDFAGAMAGQNGAWSAPVIASRQNSALFSDKEQIWADNAASSPHFGNVYVCFAAFRGQQSRSQPLIVLTSRDGGDTWTSQQVTPATNNTRSRNGFGRSGCTVRTDSQGRVYVFAYQFGFSPSSAAAGKIQMITSDTGGATWSRPRDLFTAYDTCNYFEPSIGRCVEDGVAGARSDLSPAPSVDIANGAPTGTDATDRIVMSWVDGRDGLNHEHVMFTESTDRGSGWSAPTTVERPGDRGYYSAPAISPNGSDVWLVYNAFTTQFAPDTSVARNLVGVVLHADAGGSFSELHRGQGGDARGSSQNNLAAEFLGDYVYAAASRTYGAAVWNDMRNGEHCTAIDAYRQALHAEAIATGAPTAEPEEPGGGSEGDAAPAQGTEPVAPAVQQECPTTFGNSDIYGGSWSDPTP